jgi:DNA-binding CsgD family transcriptional regulator
VGESDILETVAAIYDAIGDVDRWRQLEQRLAASSEHRAEITHHLHLARRVHEQHLSATHAGDVLAAVHDQIAVAAMVVDDDGGVVRANSAARRLLASGTGLRLAHGRVEATDASDQANLRNRIAATSGARGTDVFVVIARPARRPLCVVVLPGEAHGVDVFEHQRLALLLIIDFDAPGTATTKVLRSLFDFTAREAELAAGLMAGDTIAQAARRLGISLTTARTLLARVTAKTDSHSQAELVRQLLAVPPMS